MVSLELHLLPFNCIAEYDDLNLIFFLIVKKSLLTWEKKPSLTLVFNITHTFLLSLEIW